MDAQTLWTSIDNVARHLIHQGARLDDDGRFVAKSIPAVVPGWARLEQARAIARLIACGLLDDAPDDAPPVNTTARKAAP